MATFQWFYNQNGQQHGPVNSEALQELARSGQLRKEDYVWRQGMNQWVPAGTVGNLFAEGPSPLAPASAIPASPSPVVSYATPIRATATGPTHLGKAIAALVLSICGLCIAGYILGGLGILLGYLAVRGMRTSNNKSGRGMAIAGIVIGLFAVLFATVGLIYWLSTQRSKFQWF